MINMRKMRNKIALIILSLFLILSLAACGRRDKYPDALRIGTAEIPKTLMPYASTDSANVYVCGLVYNTLLGNSSKPAGYIEGNDFYFSNGDKYTPTSTDENYYLFTDGLVGMEGAYPKKTGSDYGFEYYNPTEAEYDKQLKRKNIVKGYDESGTKIENESDEAFEIRKNKAVPKTNWMRYRFNVDERYTWNDGESFNADDIVFTFKYVLKHSGKLASIAFFLDNYFNCYNDNGDFVLELASNKLSDIKTICNSIFIIPEHIWSTISNPNEFNNLNPVGTGAYKLVEDGYIVDSSVCLEYRNDYNLELKNEMFSGDPINRIFLQKLGNEDVMLNAMDNGDIDTCLNSFSASKISQLKSSNKYSNIKICTATNEFVTTLVMNVGENGGFNENKLKNSLMVRKAISLAVNQELIIDIYLYGDGDKVGNGLVQREYLHALKDVNNIYVEHEYNLELANQILDDAGYQKNSNGLRNLSFSILAPSSNEVLVNLLSSMFKDNLGINVSFELADGQYDENIKQRNNPDFDMIINSVTFTIDKLLMFDARFGVYSSGEPRTWNYSGLNNNELSDLMNSMDTALTIKEQYEICANVQKLLIEQYVEIPLYTSKTYSLYQESRFTGWVEPESGTILKEYSFKYLKMK